MTRHAIEQLKSAWRWVRKRGTRVGAPVDWGNLRRLQPISRSFGLDRGLPVDRYYIERFLEAHASDIHGRVLEVGDAAYTRKFGAARVSRSDVLHAVDGNPHATVVGDLSTGAGLEADAYDCLVLTQVFPFIFDVRAAVQHAHTALRPGGVMLATVPGLSQISQYDRERWGDYWRFTSQGIQRLFDQVFGLSQVETKVYGSVLAATALLQGLAAEELGADELDYLDPDYEVTIAVRAVKRKP
jgi:SAM-dependent methyltransferase